jgi:hypothetical protein
MGDVCNVVEHDGTCNYQESGWWYFCCFSAILCDKGLKPAPKYSSRMEQNNIYMETYCFFYEGHLPSPYLCQFPGGVAMTFIYMYYLVCSGPMLHQLEMVHY